MFLSWFHHFPSIFRRIFVIKRWCKGPLRVQKNQNVGSFRNHPKSIGISPGTLISHKTINIRKNTQNRLNYFCLFPPHWNAKPSGFAKAKFRRIPIELEVRVPTWSTYSGMDTIQQHPMPSTSSNAIQCHPMPSNAIFPWKIIGNHRKLQEHYRKSVVFLVSLTYFWLFIN